MKLTIKSSKQFLIEENKKIKFDDYNNYIIEVKFKPITIIIGYNASLKSLLLRSIYSLISRDKNELKRLWIDSKISEKYEINSICLDYNLLINNSKTYLTNCYNFTYSDTNINKIIIESKDKNFDENIINNYDKIVKSILIPDHRNVYRVSLLYENNIKQFKSELNDILNYVKDILYIYKQISGISEEDEISSKLKDLSYRLERLQYDFEYFYKNLLFPFIDTFINLKQEIDTDILKDILNSFDEILDIYVKTVEELNYYNYINRENYKKQKYDIKLFKINILSNLNNLPDTLEFIINDLRFGKKYKIPLTNLSSSISAYIALYSILYSLSNPRDNIFIFIEEPELTLAPPQQYIIITLILRSVLHLINNYNKNIYVIFTTHSPYVLQAAIDFSANTQRQDLIDVINLYFNYEKRIFSFGNRPLDLHSTTNQLSVNMYKNINYYKSKGDNND